MSGKVLGIAMNNGYAGTVSRTADAIIQSRIAESDLSFGKAVILTADNTWDVVAADTVAAGIAGIVVREVVQANTFDPQSNPNFPANTPCDVLVRGNVAVHCLRGTPAAGAAVYVRVAANETYPASKIGDFEASADSTNSIAVANIEWTTGNMDANGIAEVTIKSRAKG
jgi:hypothetical protein